MILKSLFERFARAVLRTDLQLLRSTIQEQERSIAHVTQGNQLLRSMTESLRADLSTAQAQAGKLVEPVVERVQMYGLDQATFDKVNQQLERPVIDKQSSSEYAAYCLGIQRAITLYQQELVHK